LAPVTTAIFPLSLPILHLPLLMDVI